MPKKIIMELRKFNREKGEHDLCTVDLTPLNDMLIPAEIFQMEYKINEIPSLRAHISVREEE